MCWLRLRCAVIKYVRKRHWVLFLSRAHTWGRIWVFFPFKLGKQCCIKVLFSKQLNRSVPPWFSLWNRLHWIFKNYAEIIFAKKAHASPLFRGWIFLISHSLFFWLKKQSYHQLKNVPHKTWILISLWNCLSWLTSC